MKMNFSAYIFVLRVKFPVFVLLLALVPSAVTGLSKHAKNLRSLRTRAVGHSTELSETVFKFDAVNPPRHLISLGASHHSSDTEQQVKSMQSVVKQPVVQPAGELVVEPVVHPVQQLVEASFRDLPFAEEPFPEVPFPVPTTSRCIVIMCLQYVIIYTALALFRTYHELKHTRKFAVEVSLAAAAQSLAHGPMLCVLLIACRMHVEFLSEGKGHLQIWVHCCIYAATFGVMGTTLLALLMPILTAPTTTLEDGIGAQASVKYQAFEEAYNKQAHPTNEEDSQFMLKLQDFGDIRSSCGPPSNEGECKDTAIMQAKSTSELYNKFVRYDLMAMRYFVSLCLYGGLAGVIAGTLVYSPPGASSHAKFVTPAPAIMCTMILSVAFFATQFVNAICASYTDFTGVHLPRIVGVMNSAATTSEFAPMLAILFLSARMRALQHNGEPQAWAQFCMYAGTFSMCTTTLLAVAVPLVMGGTVTLRANPKPQQSTFIVPDPKISYLLMALRYKCMLVCYGGALAVIISIIHWEAPGPDVTPPVSPAVHCVVSLACQFFVVYFLMTLMLSISELFGGDYQLESYKFFAAIEAARATVSFAPMLCMIFVTTRMHALLITDKQGSPPAWAQFGMYMATWSLMISILMCLLSGLVMGDVGTDEEGSVVNKFNNWYLGIAMTVVRYVVMLTLYGGMALVIVDLFTMTPETAQATVLAPEMQWWRLHPPMGAF